MRYVSLDVETTGLDSGNDQILEFAAVFDDLENREDIERLPVFHCYVKHARVVGNAFAINMNAYAIGVIAGKVKAEFRGKPAKIVRAENVTQEFYNFITTVGMDESVGNRLCEKDYTTREALERGGRYKLNVAGKNPAFDLGFLTKLEGWDERFKVAHRVIDPAVMYMRAGDKTVPSLQECLERAGIQREVKHTAAADAYDVIDLIRDSVV